VLILLIFAVFYLRLLIINGDGGYGLLAVYRRACGSSRLAWFKGRRLTGVVLYSSCELTELSQWLCHNDITINVVVGNIIIVIIRPMTMSDLSPTTISTQRIDADSGAVCSGSLSSRP